MKQLCNYNNFKYIKTEDKVIIVLLIVLIIILTFCCYKMIQYDILKGILGFLFDIIILLKVIYSIYIRI